MPKIYTFKGYDFFFYSNEHLPIHIHVDKNGKGCKINLETFEVENYNLNKIELKIVLNIIDEKKEEFENKWKEYFLKR